MRAKNHLSAQLTLDTLRNETWLCSQQKRLNAENRFLSLVAKFMKFITPKSHE